MQFFYLQRSLCLSDYLYYLIYHLAISYPFFLPTDIFSLGLNYLIFYSTSSCSFVWSGLCCRFLNDWMVELPLISEEAYSIVDTKDYFCSYLPNEKLFVFTHPFTTGLLKLIEFCKSLLGVEECRFFKDENS